MRCPRADLHSAPGRPWTPLVRQNDRSARSALDWDRRRRVTPAGAGSQETRPGAEPMLVATGVASPRRSAGRRARPVWRASAQRTSGAYCVHLFAKARTMDGMRLSALRLPRSFFLRVVVGMNSGAMARRESADAHPPPRSGGGGPRTCAVEGACSEEVCLEACASVDAEAPSTMLRMVPLPRFAGQDEASGTAEAPSTMLRAVPLPRFAGQDKFNACGRRERRLEMRVAFGARCRCRR